MKNSLTLGEARAQNRLDEFADQQRGKAEVPNAKSRFDRLLSLMAGRSSKEDAGT